MVEDRNVMQRHYIYMMSFVLSKVQSTVVFSFGHVIYNNKDKQDCGKNNIVNI